MTPTPLLQVEGLKTHFPVKAGPFSQVKDYVHAVDGVSFSLQTGEVLALVGESGCGKSTLVLTLMGLEKPTAGHIWFAGHDIATPAGQKATQFRRQMQMIFQDPFESLNPMLTVGDLVAEPLVIHKLAGQKGERLVRVRQVLEEVGLKPADSFINRRPYELSGGQRQRVSIAGALILQPKLLLADEPVSMLDVSIRAEILNLLADLRQQKGIAILFITHDLATAASFADRVAVMYLGRIVEQGATNDILRAPAHPYTQALLSAIPTSDPRSRRQRQLLAGDPPNPINLPAGCRFGPRCPVHFARCDVEEPALLPLGEAHFSACWLNEK